MIFMPAPESLTQEDLNNWSSAGSCGIVLNSIGNDHNLGAIVRSAAFFDFKYIVTTQGDSCASLTTSAYRVAEGGMEHVTVRSVRDCAAFLGDACRRLLTIGTDPRARLRISDLSRLIEDRRKENQGKRPGIALVFGNEESGLPDNVKAACSAIMRIPGTGLMESLNVAQTASVFMHRVFEL
jgi:TrmH RNA methyltransferase